MSRLAERFAFRPRALAVLALVSANVVWGGSAVASKALIADVPPLTLASLRVAISLVLLRLLLAWKHERPATGSTTALLGLTGVALFCACQNLGLLLADASTAALLNGAIPVLTVGLAVPILHERLTASRLAALLVCAMGVSLIVLFGPGDRLGTSSFATLLPLASAMAFALYTVLARRAFATESPLAIVTGSTHYGLLFLLPGTALELTRAEIKPITTQDGVLLLYLGAGCSALAFLLCGYGLCRLEAGHGALFGNLKPLVGVCLAIVLLGEPLTGSRIAGGLLVLLGVGIATGRWSLECIWRPSSREDDPVMSLNGKPSRERGRILRRRRRRIGSAERLTTYRA